MTNGSEHHEFFAELVADLDAEFEWVTPSMPHLGVIGPRSREVVQKLTDEDLGALRYFRFIPHPVRSAASTCTCRAPGTAASSGTSCSSSTPPTPRPSGTPSSARA